MFNEGWTFGFRRCYGDKWVDEFVRFTRIVADKIHAADPEVTVMVAAEDGWSALHDMLCKSIGKAGECVSFHPYAHADDPRPERKDLFFRIHGVECIMQYDFRDDDFSKTDPECNFGLVRRDNTPKKSYSAVCAMTRLVGELEPAGDLSHDQAVYHMMRFRGKGGRDVLAAWSVEGEVKVPRPAWIPPTAVRYDLLVAALGSSVPETLSLTEDPVYLEFTRLRENDF